MATAARLQELKQSMKRPYPVAPQIFLMLLIAPVYFFIPGFLAERTFHTPELALDRAIPVLPVWSFVYIGLYAFLILTPVFIVREAAHTRRLFSTYMAVWLISYVFFVIYPTKAPRPPVVVVDGFASWGLQQLYDSDTPFNCLPSIHVGHSFVSAFACYGVHRKVGLFALVCATLVALSTLFTKQHYVLDLVGGIGLAALAYQAFSWWYPSVKVSDEHLRVAPWLTASVFAICSSAIGAAWLIYRFEHVLKQL
jgi:membrane-associated phospholipid phosphatase